MDITLLFAYRPFHKILYINITPFFATMKYIVSLFLILIATSCLYEMPKEDDINIVPTTNNPNITRNPTPVISPAIDY